jgi:hypothetical protein
VGKLNALEYLFFEFLHALCLIGTEPEDGQVISRGFTNASVLCADFEKINGYKDGSFVRRVSITMYMCRGDDTAKAVVQKF